MTEVELQAPGQHSAGELALHVTEIARVLLAPTDPIEVLRRITVLSVTVIDACQDAGLCNAGPVADHMQTSALLTQLDQLQTTLGEGPCVDAFNGHDSVYAADLASDARWPRFGPLAAEAGVRSVIAYRLFSQADTVGALHLYSSEPDAFSVTDRAQGLIFAAHAAVALDVARREEELQDRGVNLQLALASREIIGQAQGILMERELITAEQAFDLLRTSSQHLNLRLRDVAQELVDTGVYREAEDRSGPDSV